MPTKSKTDCSKCSSTRNVSNKKSNVLKSERKKVSNVKVEKAYAKTQSLSTTKASKDSKSLAPCSSLKNNIVKPKKTTKSEVCCAHRPCTIVIKNNFDYCKHCGDTLHSTDDSSSKNNKPVNGNNIDSNSKYNKSILNISTSTIRKTVKLEPPKTDDKPNQGVLNVKIPKCIPDKPKPEYVKDKRVLSVKMPIYFSEKPLLVSEEINTGDRIVQQYYKNDNFRSASASAQEISNLKKVLHLDTINELPEVQTAVEEQSSNTESSVFHIYESESDTESDEIDNIKNLQDFRDENYFECHNTRARIKSKGSATSLTDHKCSYRFYLNDRLFPVPLNSDHKKNIRCVECHLPLPLSGDPMNTRECINGTIQAKVKIGNDTADTVLMLPVKDSLIIKEKRKKIRRELDKADIVYFGIIKLDAYGYSEFNQTLPCNSLALKYQKGYKKLNNVDDKRNRLKEGDIVYV